MDNAWIREVRVKDKFTKDSYVKEVYYRVMMELLEKKDFLDITTTEIIENSGLSRATFYKHFRDKYELAAWKFGALFVHALMPDEFTSTEVSAENYRKNINYIYENRKYFRNLFGYNGQNSFQDYYVRYPKELAETIAAHSGRSLSTRDYYTITYHAAGAAQVLKDWIQADCPMTVDEVCDLLIKNRNNLVAELYVVKK